METELSNSIYLTWFVMLCMFVARVAESVQKRRERAREKQDRPLLNMALKSYERQIGKRN